MQSSPSLPEGEQERMSSMIALEVFGTVRGASAAARGDTASATRAFRQGKHPDAAAFRRDRSTSNYSRSTLARSAGVPRGSRRLRRETNLRAQRPINTSQRKNSTPSQSAPCARAGLNSRWGSVSHEGANPGPVFGRERMRRAYSGPASSWSSDRARRITDSSDF